MNRTLLTLILSLLFIGSSCDITQQVMKDYENHTQTQSGPSENEVIQGLKRALQIGAETAVKDLGVTNAFYSNEAYKILLPKEAQVITDNKDNPLLKVVGIDKLISDAEKSMNRAAEKAVYKAKPIFLSTITSMSIQDAFGILNGSETAATDYLKRKTYTQLFQEFKPEVNQVLNQAIYQNISTQQSWDQLTTAYNQVAQYVPDWNTVNVDLADYVTHKALDALFEEVKKEEMLIRKDPSARAEEILKKVFG